MLALLVSASLSEAAPRRVLVIALVSPGKGEDEAVEFLRQRLKADPPPGGEVQLVVLDGSVEETTGLQMAQEVLRHLPAAAVVGGSENMARALRDLAPTLPVVFDAFQDPRRACAAERLDRPGGNATGTFTMSENGGKMAEMLLMAYPALKHLVVLLDEEERGQQPCPQPFPPRPAGERCQAGWVTQPERLNRLIAVEQFAALTANPAIDLRYWRVCQVADLSALAAQGPPRDAGLIVPMRDRFYFQADALVRQVRLLRWPAAYQGARFAYRGGLMALNDLVLIPDILAAEWNLLRQILAGRPAGSLPVEQPRSQELVFNRAAARQAHLVPSARFLRRVDRFIDRPQGAAAVAATAAAPASSPSTTPPPPAATASTVASRR